MSTTTKSANISTGPAFLLGLLFVGLKLGHVIAWSWLWVLAPFWIPFAVLLAAVVITVLILVAMEVWK